MNEFKCVMCHETITGKIYESDGFTGGKINKYCLNCFYENVKVAFNQFNLICKCGQPLVIGEGSSAVEFEENFELGTIEYICHEINYEKYDWYSPGQYEKNALKNHTRIVKDGCREKTVAEKMLDELEAFYQIQKEDIQINCIQRLGKVGDFKIIDGVKNFESQDLQLELEMLELERECAIRKAVIFKLMQKGKIQFLKYEEDYYGKFIENRSEYQNLIQSCSIEINRKFDLEKLTIEKKYQN